MATNQQYVYVMSNPAFDSDVLKIGWTADHPSVRAQELYTTGVPTPFSVKFAIITGDGHNLERQIHAKLDSFRLNSNREFFKISTDTLIEILTNDLKLDIMYNLPDIKIGNKLPRALNKNIMLCNNFEQAFYQFIDKLRQPNTQLRASKTEKKVWVYHFPQSHKCFRPECHNERIRDKIQLNDIQALDRIRAIIQIEDWNELLNTQIKDELQQKDWDFLERIRGEIQPKEWNILERIRNQIRLKLANGLHDPFNNNNCMENNNKLENPCDNDSYYLCKGIIHTLKFMERTLWQCKQDVDIQAYEIEEIKERIGEKFFKEDTVFLKTQIIKTHTELNELQSKFKWEF